MMRDEANPGASQWTTGEGDSRYAGASGRGPQQAGENAKKGCFPRPVRAKECQTLTGCERETNAGYGFCGGELARELYDLDDGRCRGGDLRGHSPRTCPSGETGAKHCILATRSDSARPPTSLR